MIYLKCSNIDYLQQINYDHNTRTFYTYHGHGEYQIDKIIIQDEGIITYGALINSSLTKQQLLNYLNSTITASKIKISKHNVFGWVKTFIDRGIDSGELFNFDDFTQSDHFKVVYI